MFALASVHDERDDFAWIGKDHIRAVARHARSDKGRSVLFGTVATRVSLQAEIALPKPAGLSVSGCDRIGVLAVGDRLHPVLGIKVLEVRNSSATHAAHAAHLSALGDRGSRLCGFL